ncbi:MAG: HRDC domain-containing protein [Anaerolineales bacterium]
MNPPLLPAPILIENQESLKEMSDRLTSEPLLAVDTESNSLYAYQEQVCLIQFSIPGFDYLVDSLAVRDLSTLAPLFSNPAIEKVLHGAEYDVMCLARDFDFQIDNLFDTRVASRTLAWKRNSLSDLLEQVLSINVDKRFQRANWGKRPLSSEMLDYARLDTHYLLKLRDHFHQLLRNNGRLEEAQELCERMTNPPCRENGFSPDDFWRVAHSRELSQRKAAILRELYLMRDRHARRQDRPPFKILGDQSLLAIARSGPRTTEELHGLPGLTNNVIRRYGAEFIAAVEDGLKAPLPQKPRNRRLDEAVHARYEALREWRKNAARKRKLESDIILPRDLLVEIATRTPRDLADLREIMDPLESRFQRYGEEILRIIQ